jgi:hypothetical protein
MDGLMIERTLGAFELFNAAAKIRNYGHNGLKVRAGVKIVSVSTPLAR